MSWMSQLYQTYEKHSNTDAEDEVPMTPVAHMYATAQVEIVIDAGGNFSGAKSVEKAEGVTLIPVTEASAGRASGIAPHPLCDTLSYVAGDYGKHCTAEKEKKRANEKFDAYMDRLNAWAQSEWSHPKVEAILKYLKKKELIEDLVKSGIVDLEADGTFCNKKISGQPYEKALVRFKVLGTANSQDDGTWEDNSLVEAYTNYYLSTQSGRQDICYLTGQEKTISDNHPKGIVAANYGAKIISANDGQGYTYRGRFQDSKQAYALSYEASQEIHSALTWLIKHQGVYAGTQEKRTFVCWSPDGKKTPDIIDAFDLNNNEKSEDVGVPYRKKLSKMLHGYREQFDQKDQIIVMALDAATTGRLSITYYNEFSALGFLDRIEYWGQTCRWNFLKLTPERKAFYEEETPSFRRIVECAFGRQRGAFIDVDDKVLKEQMQRLMKCMLEKQPFPMDILQALINRASTPLAYSSWNREIVLSTACAVIEKHFYDLKNEGGEEQMKLDLENRDRSYLFGRLLAILEKVERITYDAGETRETNAIRLQSAYVNHPMQTWELLDDALRPYFQKLNPGSREYYKGMISGIIGQLEEEDESFLNQRLKETYLLGYYLQRAELNKKKEEKANE